MDDPTRILHGIHQKEASRTKARPKNKLMKPTQVQIDELLKSYPGVCMECGEPMRHNVPRLGPDGGYIHAKTGRFSCADKPDIGWVSNGVSSAYVSLEDVARLNSASTTPPTA